MASEPPGAAMIARLLAAALLVVLALPARAFTFPSVDGGTIDLDALRGRAVLVVNTASLCGFAPQLAELQALHERYAPRGLTVIAVPSDDFRQELDTGAQARAYCESTYGLTLPMTEIMPILGADAHPFYRWLEGTHGAVPRWNFNKALLDGEGRLVAFEGAPVRPLSARFTALVERALPGS
jgi:glutathione peroxidase